MALATIYGMVDDGTRPDVRVTRVEYTLYFSFVVSVIPNSALYLSASSVLLDYNYIYLSRVALSNRSIEPAFSEGDASKQA